MPGFGLPRDAAQGLALVFALAVLAAARPLFRARERGGARLAALAALAAGLSAAYVVAYLRGGPRIIDATSYYLEARALAEGSFSFATGEPVQSVLGRFLVLREEAGGARCAVIFPPGYPAMLALGFLLGAPLAVGPALAAGITVATYHLGRQVAASAGLAARPVDPPSTGWLAALFSVACAALRYHTADTMAHGLAALGFASSLALAFAAADASARGREGRRRALLYAAGCGLALGWLVATRPASGLALAVTLAVGLGRLTAWPASSFSRARLACACALGAAPGLALLLAHQHAATGSWGASSQQLYYAVSDGPPGCFRYGFGAGIGCVGEHGSFVRAHLGAGYGAVAAAGTTLRRLWLHLLDVGNFEPLALLVPLALWTRRASGRVRLLGLAILAQLLAYAPFYFDGNYPGGGARFYADVLPLEHALAALAVAGLAGRTRAPARWQAAAIASSLLGFAFHAGFAHAALRDREGGRPMFEPARLAEAGVPGGGLVFVDTDHGFDLGFDPAAAEPNRAGAGVEVVRFHGDALDRFAWDARGRPPAYRYRFDAGRPVEAGPASPTVERLDFDLTAPLAIEGESLWPPIAQPEGFALPEFASGTCASGSRVLALHASRGRAARVELSLPARALAGLALAPQLTWSGDASGEVTLLADGAPVHRWPVPGSPPSPGMPLSPDGKRVSCRALPFVALPARARTLVLSVARDAGDDSLFALDQVLVGDPKTIDPSPRGM